MTYSRFFQSRGFVESLFIFMGVLLAFMADDYRERREAIESLQFNMEQIVRDLPDEEPSGEYEKLTIKLDKPDNEGKCAVIYTTWGRSYSPVGEFYLETISYNDLSRFLSDRSVIGFLNYYYKGMRAEAREASRVFEQAYLEVVQKHFNGKCFSQKEIGKFTAGLTHLYKLMIFKELLSRSFGYQIREKLIAMGFPPPISKSEIKVQINPKEVDSLSEKKDEK